MLSLPLSKTNKDSHMKLRKWFYLEEPTPGYDNNYKTLLKEHSK